MTTTKRTDGRETRGQETRSLVIQAAIQCIAQSGLSKTTIAKVAEAAGVSHALVIFHFKSKENLFSNVLKEVGAPWREGWSAIENDDQLSAREKILALTNFEVRHASQNPDCIAVWFAFWGLREGISLYSDVTGPRDAYENHFVRSLISDACASYSEETSAIVGAGLSALVWGYMARCHVEETPPPPENTLKAIETFLSAHFDT
jgi:AcrR family transcriptional regulator